MNTDQRYGGVGSAGIAPGSQFQMGRTCAPPHPPRHQSAARGSTRQYAHLASRSSASHNFAPCRDRCRWHPRLERRRRGAAPVPRFDDRRFVEFGARADRAAGGPACDERPQAAVGGAVVVAHWPMPRDTLHLARGRLARFDVHCMHSASAQLLAETTRGPSDDDREASTRREKRDASFTRPWSDFCSCKSLQGRTCGKNQDWPSPAVDAYVRVSSIHRSMLYV